MTTLIFGGAGFIGTNLTKTLLEKGHKVICVDNFYTGRESNIEQFYSNKNYTFIREDICKNIPDIKADEIYNLACPASPPKYQQDPIYTIHCSLAVENICKLAMKYNAKLLHASTSEVYGDPLVHPQKENYYGNVNIVGPRSCYDEGKRIAETILYEYNKLGCRTKIVRIFNTYGPYMDPNDGRVISNFINQALQNKDITIYGNGLQTRSFMYINDLIRGLLLIMESENSITPINIGNPVEKTILDIANMIKFKTGSKSKIIFKEGIKDDPEKRKPDISKMLNLFNWKPEISLEEGLEKTILFF